MDKELVYLEWLDSHSFYGWISHDDITCEIPVIKTIGWIVKESEHAITISATIAESCVDCPMTIPKFAIRLRKAISLEKVYAAS